MANNKKLTNAETLAQYIAQAQKLCEQKVKEANANIKAGKLTAYNSSKSELEKAVKTLNGFVTKANYEVFMTTDKPMITAIKQFYIDSVRVKEELDKDTKMLLGVKLDKRQVTVDLEGLCDYAKIDKKWTNDCARLLALLSTKEVEVFNIKPEELATKSRYFIDAVRAKKSGETPDSNTQIVKLIQQIIDEVCFVDNGEGKNAYKVTNHDIAFIQDATTRLDTKQKCTVSMLNERQFKRVMLGVFAHALGEAYKVTEAKIKTKF